MLFWYTFSHSFPFCSLIYAPDLYIDSPFIIKGFIEQLCSRSFVWIANFRWNLCGFPLIFHIFSSSLLENSITKYGKYCGVIESQASLDILPLQFRNFRFFDFSFSFVYQLPKFMGFFLVLTICHGKKIHRQKANSIFYWFFLSVF